MTNATVAKLTTLALTLSACEVVDWNFSWGAGSASSSSSASSTGSAMLCVPGAMKSCYDGPAGTEGVGLCKAGAEACAADGMSWGVCAGEVLPVPMEDCASGQDQDCDGMVKPCKGTLLWAKDFGNASGLDFAGATCVVVDASGNVLVGGLFAGTVDFGGGPFTSSGDASIFLVKLDATSTHVWSEAFDVPAAAVTGIVVDANGDVAITGYFLGVVDFGGGVLTALDGEDVFVAKLDASGGHLWSKSFGGVDDQTAAGIAIQADGNVLVTGTFSGSVDFGGGTVTSAGGQDIFVASLDTTGGYVWAKRFGDASDQQGASIATGETGSIFITGAMMGSVDFGGGALTSAGGQDIFVANLDTSGGYVWARRFGDTSDQQSASVAAGKDGSVFITGAITGKADFGGPCGVLASAGGQDIFVASIDKLGNCLWAERYGNAVDQQGASIATHVGGEVVLTGAMRGQTDFGDGPLASVGGQDIFAAKLDADGGYLWAKRFGDAAAQSGTAIATDTAGNTFVVGNFNGSVDFGANTLLTSAGGQDVFIAKFGP